MKYFLGSSIILEFRRLLVMITVNHDRRELVDDASVRFRQIN